MGAGATPAGWYPDVERPGGERYWDGSLWTEDRRNAGEVAGGVPPTAPGSAPPGFGQQPPAYGQQPPTYDQQNPGYGQQPPTYGAQPAYGSPVGYTPFGAAGSQYPKSSAPVWALSLSIAGLVLTICCFGFVLSIPGTIMGWTSMKAIDRGERDPSQRGISKAAFIVGVIGVALGVLWILVILITGSFDTN